MQFVEQLSSSRIKIRDLMVGDKPRWPEEAICLLRNCWMDWYSYIKIWYMHLNFAAGVLWDSLHWDEHPVLVHSIGYSKSRLSGLPISPRYNGGASKLAYLIRSAHSSFSQNTWAHRALYGNILQEWPCEAREFPVMTTVIANFLQISKTSISPARLPIMDH
jgi:hypothetical protein